MNKKFKIIATIFIIAIISLALYFFYKKNKESEEDEEASSGGSGNIQTSATDYPIKLGIKNNAVKQFQKALIKGWSESLPKHGADGNWGAETEAAVNKYLEKNVFSNQAEWIYAMNKAKGFTIKLSNVAKIYTKLLF